MRSKALTGTRQMDATAILDYFAPLSTWLDSNGGQPVGAVIWTDRPLAVSAAHRRRHFRAAGPASAAQTDLDAFMRQVVARRDDNWKKLQQYVLDEREQFELRGPRARRSGASAATTPGTSATGSSSAARSRSTASRSAKPSAGVRSRITCAKRSSAANGAWRRVGADRQPGPDGPAAPATPHDVDGVIRQTREPQFISSAYFLRFKFEEGKYALVGRETLDGRDVLRIEYYPARMFGGTDRRRTGKEPSAADKARDAEFQRLMNKVALVTLWVEPNAHQIVKYTFDNVGFDFLPSQWLVHISDAKATMTVGQPFPDVWLPSSLDVSLAMTLAVGQFDLRYGLAYHDYRRPDVTSKVGIK